MYAEAPAPAPAPAPDPAPDAPDDDDLPDGDSTGVEADEPPADEPF